MDVSNELEDLRAEAESGELWKRTIPTPQPRRWKTWVWVLSAVAVSLLGMTGYLVNRRIVPVSEPSQAAPSLLVGTHSQLTFDPGPERDPSFSPDGRSFVYSSYGLGSKDIYLRRVSGGKVINLTEGSKADDLHPAFSPDGEQIAFRSESSGGGIFVMGAMGEDLRQLTDFGYFPSWSPDGETIVFSTGWRRLGDSQDRNQRIWTVAVESGDLHEVLDHSALQPDWSPSSQRIAFWGTRSGLDFSYDIFTVPADGGEPVAVTQDPSLDFEPVWSPDGRYLYFGSYRGGTPNLWRVRVDQDTGEVLGGAEPITSGTFYALGGLSVARDGGRLAYHVRTGTRQIQSVAFDTATERVIGVPTPVTPTGLEAEIPSISPDGAWVAFAAYFPATGYRTSIGVIRTDGTDLRQLTDSGQTGAGDHWCPAWSPDGQRVAFWSDRSGSYQVWIVQRDGSGLKQLTDILDKGVTCPVWSPEGDRLATSVLYGSAYVFDADKPWSEQPPSELPIFETANKMFFAPWSWSPDGSILAGHIGGEKEDGSDAGGIVLFSFDTGEYQQIADLGKFPKWLADGRRIFFTAGQQEPARFLLLDTESGQHHEVLSPATVGIAPDRIFWYPALSPDNRTVFFTRIHEEADIWMLTLGEPE